MAKIVKITQKESKMEASFPDIDIDVDGNYRQDIMNYFFKKYGTEHAAFIGNKNFYSLKSAVQDVSSVFEIPSKEMFAVTKLLNDDLTISENKEKNSKIKEYFDKYPEIENIAEKLTGVLRNLSIHAGGVVLTDKKYPLNRYCPLQRTSDNGALATLFDKNEIEKFGFVKYDILGLNTSRQIFDVRELKNYPLYEDTEKYQDEVFKDIILNLKNKNIFQFETNVGKNAMKDLKPMNIRELSAASGVIRLLDSVTGLEVYRKYKERCLKAFQDKNDDFWKMELYNEIEDHDLNYDLCCEILEETKGILIYQEQLCFFVSKFSRGKKTFSDGNKLRKILGKFRDKYGRIEECQGNEEKLKNWHKGMMEVLNEYILPYIGKDGYSSSNKTVQDFLNCRLIKDENGKPELILPDKGILNWIISGSVYIFSKLHSIAYSKMSYIQMYQKYHYPREFWYAAIINRDKKKLSDIIGTIHNEKANIKILPPDINNSDFSFTLEGKNGIRFGLSYITAMQKVAEKIIEVRKTVGKFKSIEHFLSNVKINKKQLFLLLVSNSFNDFGTLEEVYKQIIKLREIEEITDFSSSKLAELEFQALSVNITFVSEFVLKAQDYLSLHDLGNEISSELCIRLEKKTMKKTNTGKNYYFYRCLDYNSGDFFNVFEWDVNKGELLKEGDNLIIKVKKKGDFISVDHYSGGNNFSKRNMFLKKFLKY